MKRGDVVRTLAEFLALPIGSSVTAIEGRIIDRRNHDRSPGEDVFPALVRVVGPVEPEWLEAAAEGARANGLTGWKNIARAAVAAADKARGIVNSHEELNAYANECRQAGRSFVFAWPEVEGVEPIYPAVVRLKP